MGRRKEERSEWVALARGPWHRRLGRSRAAWATVASLCIVVAATGGFLVSQQGVTHAVSLTDALAQYRSTNGTVTTTVTLTATGEQAAAGGAPLGQPEVTTSTVSPQVQETARSAGATPSTPAVTPAASATPFDRPATGLYTYAATGGEHISVLGARHDYPSTVYAALTHGAGCQWALEFKIAKEHDEQRTWCSQPGKLSVLADTGTISFFGASDTVAYDCSPPALVLAVGDASSTMHQATCRRGDDVIRDTVTNLGQVPLVIGGQTMMANRFRVIGQMTGKSNGTAHFEYWSDPHTGLPLRVDREVHTTAHAAFGNVQYDEIATLQIVSVTPQR